MPGRCYTLARHAGQVVTIQGSYHHEAEGPDRRLIFHYGTFVYVLKVHEPTVWFIAQVADNFKTTEFVSFQR